MFNRPTSPTLQQVNPVRPLGSVDFTVPANKVRAWNSLNTGAASRFDETQSATDGSRVPYLGSQDGSRASQGTASVSRKDSKVSTHDSFYSREDAVVYPTPEWQQLRRSSSASAFSHLRERTPSVYEPCPPTPAMAPATSVWVERGPTPSYHNGFSQAGSDAPCPSTPRVMPQDGGSVKQYDGHYYDGNKGLSHYERSGSAYARSGSASRQYALSPAPIRRSQTPDLPPSSASATPYQSSPRPRHEHRSHPRDHTPTPESRFYEPRERYAPEPVEVPEESPSSGLRRSVRDRKASKKAQEAALSANAVVSRSASSVRRKATGPKASGK